MAITLITHTATMNGTRKFSTFFDFATAWATTSAATTVNIGMTRSSTAPIRKSASTAKQASTVRLATRAGSSPTARPTPQTTPNRPRPTTPRARPGPRSAGSRAAETVISRPPEELYDQRRGRAAVGAHGRPRQDHARGHKEDRGREQYLLVRRTLHFLERVHQGADDARAGVRQFLHGALGVLD